MSTSSPTPTPPLTSRPSRGAPGGVPGTPGAHRGQILRAWLWVVLVVSTVGNAVASAAGAATTAHLGLAVITAACVAALVLLHLRGRR